MMTFVPLLFLNGKRNSKDDRITFIDWKLDIILFLEKKKTQHATDVALMLLIVYED